MFWEHCCIANKNTQLETVSNQLFKWSELNSKCLSMKWSWYQSVAYIILKLWERSVYFPADPHSPYLFRNFASSSIILSFAFSNNNTNNQIFSLGQSFKQTVWGRSNWCFTEIFSSMSHSLYTSGTKMYFFQYKLGIICSVMADLTRPIHQRL